MFDRVFVSSPAWVQSFLKLGSASVEYLPFASDTLVHGPVNISARDYQIGFVGTWRREREMFLELLCDFDVVIWGSNYWRSRTKPGSVLKRKWIGKSLDFDKFPQACADTRIMINLIDGHTWPGPNMRCFELAGCGAFQLVTRTPAVVEIFCEGETIECFDTLEEARLKIDYYLKNEKQRMRIAAAAHQFIVDRKHTYIDRAHTIINGI
jgi:spore maturation protein CgeB